MFSFFVFLFRSFGKEEHFYENSFRHSNGNYFRSAVLNVAGFQLSSKFFLKKLRGTLTNAFERDFTVEDFTDMD